MSYFQSTKLIDSDGTAQPVDVADGIVPVSGPVTDAELRAEELPVSGDVLTNILIELRVISILLSCGLNLNEDLEQLRNDLGLDYGGS